MPNFDSPFTFDELRGYFRWSSDLSRLLAASNRWMYHACHEDHLKRFDKANEMWLRSRFNVDTGDEIERHECSWLSLQPWHLTHGHNHFGPWTIQLPIDLLEGRTFYVFRRLIRGWRH